MLFYTSIFKNAAITGPGSFVLEGCTFYAFDGGPMFKFTEAISIFVNCDTQEEVNYYWEKLSEGGQTSRCGWLKDKFGLSWQIIPTMLGRMLNDADREKAKRVMNAMLQMSKIEVEKLLAAYAGE